MEDWKDYSKMLFCYLIFRMGDGFLKEEYAFLLQALLQVTLS